MSEHHGYIASTVHARAGEHHEHHHHVSSWQLLTGVLLALLFFTAATVWISNAEQWIAATWNIVIPQWVNVAVAMSIATVKAIMVCAVFMHLAKDKAINTIALLFCILGVGLFLGFTALDLVTGRGKEYAWTSGEVVGGGTGATITRMEYPADPLTGLHELKWLPDIAPEGGAVVRVPVIDPATNAPVRDASGRFVFDDAAPATATPRWEWKQADILVDSQGHPIVDAATGQPAWNPANATKARIQIGVDGPIHLWARDRYANPLLEYFKAHGDPRARHTDPTHLDGAHGNSTHAAADRHAVRLVAAPSSDAHGADSHSAHGHAFPSPELIDAMLASAQGSRLPLDPEIAAEKATWAKIARYGQIEFRRLAAKSPALVAQMTLDQRVAAVLHLGEAKYAKSAKHGGHHGHADTASAAERRAKRIGLTAASDHTPTDHAEPAPH